MAENPGSECGDRVASCEHGEHMANHKQSLEVWPKSPRELVA